MSISPALWSALAASFSAFSSILIMLIQRRNLLESIRPEILLTDWSRFERGDGDSRHDVVKFSKIRNVGRGAALNVLINCNRDEKSFPVFSCSTMLIPFIPKEESEEVDGSIIIWWKNVKKKDDQAKFLPIVITAHYWDSRDVRHTTTYSLLAMEPTPNAGMLSSMQIAPQVMLSQRTSLATSGWFLRLKGKVKKLTNRLKKKIKPAK